MTRHYCKMVNQITVSTAPGWQGVSAVEIGPDEILVVFEDQLWEPVRDDKQVVRHLVAHKVRLEPLPIESQG